MSQVVIVIVCLPVLLAVFTRFTSAGVPRTRSPHEETVARVDLSLLGRLRMYGGPAMLFFAVAVTSTVGGWVSTPVLTLAAIVVVGLLAIPVRYSLTTEGIAIGWMTFRRWTEFGGVVRRHGGVRLQGIAGRRGMTVWLSGRPDDDEFVLLLRRLVRASYTGQVIPRDAVSVEVLWSPSGCLSGWSPTRSACTCAEG